MEQEKINLSLTAIWNRILVVGKYVKVLDNEYKVNTEKVNIIRPEKWYICSKCKRITPYNLRGVCPSYKCLGESDEIDLQQEYVDNHYYRIYQELDIRNMRVVEHHDKRMKRQSHLFL